MNLELNKNLNRLLILEEILMLLLSIFLFGLITDYSWWWYVLLFFLPDISFAAYLINSQTGAVFYNLLHHKGLMVVTGLIGYYAEIPILLAIGIIFFGHASFDRIFGYGLKFSDDFHHTHLGWIGMQN